MSRQISDAKKQQILELYFCSNDQRLNVISEITNSSDNTVSKIIQECFDKRLAFERGDFRIMHSKMNIHEKKCTEIETHQNGSFSCKNGKQRRC